MLDKEFSIWTIPIKNFLDSNIVRCTGKNYLIKSISDENLAADGIGRAV